jgi:hypothetical protein
MGTRRDARRWVLGGLAALAIAAPSCATNFVAPSRIEGLRVLAVVANDDKSYAQPGEQVEFQMTYVAGGDFAGKPIQITWLGGCVDPPDDTYYGCYETFQEIFDQLQGGGSLEDVEILQGTGLDRFTITLPMTIITDHDPPTTGSAYGIEYVFFAACAGKVAPIPTDQAGPAGSFPLGCFDENGNRVGPDGFVAGFTQVFAFADERTNANPHAVALRIKRDKDPNDAFVALSDSPTEPFDVGACKLDEDERRQLGCGKDPYSQCTSYTIDLEVDDNLADYDEAADENGKKLYEAVWVDWYTDGGDFEADVSLLWDTRKGLVKTDQRSTRWIPPPEPGEYSIWGVVHDARGGAEVWRGYVQVD